MANMDNGVVICDGYYGSEVRDGCDGVVNTTLTTYNKVVDGDR